MSGFVGSWRRDGTTATRGALEAMLEAIDHRGPDGTGRWIEGSVSLGYQRLQTTEEEGPRPPIRSEDGRIALTGDFRLDNRPELLSILGIDDSTVTDGELILAAYRRWGRRCPEKLIGPFAFVVWDAAEPRIFCARDFPGVRPFYVFADESIVVVGSEAKAVLAHPAVPTVIDELRIGEYLVDERPDNRRTFYEDVERLPPAHSRTFGQAKSTEWRYWQLDPDYEVNFSSDAAYARESRRLFDQAVRCRLRGIEKPAVTLSGGLDSSSVAGVLRAQFGSPVHTFSNTFDGFSGADEREYIEAVLEQGGFVSHFIDGTAVDPLHDLEERVRLQDGPVLPAEFWHSKADAEAISEAGCRVMFTGWGGDQTVSHGRARPRELAMNGSVLELAREMRALHEQGTRYRSQVWGELVVPLAPMPLRRLWRLVYQDESASAVPTYVDDAFARRVSLGKHLEQVRDTSSPPRTVRRNHIETLTHPFQVRFLELGDRIAAHAGVEPRYPFTDRRLIEYCVALPSEQKRRNGFGRFVLRNAMEDVLPEEVRTRTSKAEFAQVYTDLFASQLRDIGGIEECEYIQQYSDISELAPIQERLGSESEWSNVNLVAKSLTLERWLSQIER